MEQHICELISKESKRILAEELCEDTYPIMNHELMELFGDIVGELCTIDPSKKDLIYSLGDLLREEGKLYQPEDAYEAGVLAQNENSDNSCMSYIKEVVLSPAAVEVFAKRDKVFFELVALLGDTSGLVSEFIEAYRNCNNIVSKKIDVFFDMGLAARG